MRPPGTFCFAGLLLVLALQACGSRAAAGPETTVEVLDAFSAGEGCTCPDGSCVTFYDTACTALGSICVKLPPACQNDPCGSCNDEICGNEPGQVWFGCGGSGGGGVGQMCPDVWGLACYGP